VDGFEDTTFSGSDNTYNLTAGADVRISMSGLQNGRYFPGSIDDVRIFDRAITDIDVKIISDFLESTNPDPADGAKIVDTSAILSWSPGPLAAEFDIYFGTNPEPGVNELVGRVSEATHVATNLAKGQTYYWRVDDVEVDGTTIHTGNVWSLWIPPKGTYNPNPVNGQEVTDTDTDLSWDANWSPVMYVVHFGTDVDQVNNIPVGVGPPWLQIGSDPGPLEPGMTYYWRIDVLYETWVIGEVWSFTVADFIVIDDFESYNDLDPADPESNRIFNVWLDGFDDPTNGSLVGYDQPPFAEQTTVHSGKQSMPMYYDNSGAAKSEATLTLTSNRDWTQEDVGLLSLWFQGDTSNAAEPMYVVLNGSAAVTNDNVNAAQIETWTEWRIDLTIFSEQGVNLTNVNTITLGLSSVTGGTGTIYIDDIRLYPPVP
jgi:hypothetical protein